MGFSYFYAKLRKFFEIRTYLWKYHSIYVKI